MSETTNVRTTDPATASTPQPDNDAIQALRALPTDAAIEIADGLILNGFDLDVTTDSAGSVSASGTVRVTLFDQAISLSADYQTSDGEGLLMLATQLDPPAELLSVQAVGALRIADLAIELAISTAEPEATGRAGLSLRSAAASGRLQIEGVFDVAGTLTFSRDTGSAELSFVPDASTSAVSLPLPIPAPDGQTASLQVGLGSITIGRTTSESATDPQPAQWRFDGGVNLSLRGLPSAIQSFLPAQTAARLGVADGAVTLSAERLLAPLDVIIPDIEIGGDTVVSLGTVRFDVSDLSIEVGRDATTGQQQVALSARLGLGLPSELNRIFGVNEDGSPAIEFFNTLAPSDPDNTVVQLELSISQAGVSLTPRTSPIRSIRFEGDYWIVDLLGYGTVRFQTPVFSLAPSGAEFVASGGFEIIEPLRLPLTPLKSLLSVSGLDAAANLLPDSLPIETISILDDQNNFNVDGLIDLIENVGIDLPDELRAGLEAIGDRLDQLPDNFRRYLNTRIPQSLFWDIAIRTTGDVRFHVRVGENDPAIRVLYATTTGLFPSPMPVLNGIELRGMTFGSLSSGSLFLLEVDGCIDQFDLATLAASLALPQELNLPLPDTRNLALRLVLDRLFMIIIYQAGVPIPVPIFFNEVGVEYLGLEGVEVQTHVSFPEPTIGLGNLLEAFNGLRRFFTERDYLLDPNAVPPMADLRFGLGRNFIRLPEYLGGGVLGSEQPIGSIGAYESLAALLNGLKTFELNRLIRAVPLDYRADVVNVAFGPLSMNASWLITTPREFTEQSFRRLNLPASAASQALAVLPNPAAGDAPATTDPEGLVVFLRGQWGIGRVATLEAMFGLLAAENTGFATGFAIRGTIGRVIDVDLGGRIAVNTGQEMALANLGSSRSATRPDPRSFALAFDGRDDAVVLGNRGRLDIRGPITIEAWVRPEATNGFRNIVARGHIFGPNGEVFLRIASGTYQIGSWNGVDHKTAYRIPAEDLGQWVHLAGSFDGRIWRLYRNGVEVSSAPDATGAVPVNGGWAIGSRGTGTERFFQGMIDEVRLWNRARSAAEVRADLHRQLAGNEPGLVGYWRFDEGVSSIAADATANAHHGTLRGPRWVSSTAAMAVSPTTPSVVEVVGHSHLEVLNHRIFRGDIQLSDNRFRIRGDLDLFPASFPMRASGTLQGDISAQQLQLEGAVDTSLAGLPLVQTQALISNDLIRLRGALFGQTAELTAAVENGALALNGEVVFDLDMRVILSGIRGIPGRPNVLLANSLVLDLRINARLGIKISRSGFSGRIDATFTYNGRQQTLGIELREAPASLDDLRNVIANRLVQDARQLFTQFFASGQEWLDGIRSGVITFARGSFNEVATVGRNLYGLAAEQVASVGANLVSNAREAADAFRDAGYTIEEAARGLRGNITNSTEDAVSALLAYGTNGFNITRAVWGTFTTNHNQVARAFQQVGFSAGAVLDILRNTPGVPGVSNDAARGILRAAGYAGREVDNFFRDVGNSVRDTANSARRFFGF